MINCNSNKGSWDSGAHRDNLLWAIGLKAPFLIPRLSESKTIEPPPPHPPSIPCPPPPNKRIITLPVQVKTASTRFYFFSVVWWLKKVAMALCWKKWRKRGGWVTNYKVCLAGILCNLGSIAERSSFLLDYFLRSSEFWSNSRVCSIQWPVSVLEAWSVEPL